MAKKISLDKLAKGALHMQFNRELEKVTGNIWDFNTSAKAKRRITIDIDIMPDTQRQIGEVSINVKSKLCPVNCVNTKMVFGYNEINKEGEYSELNAEVLGQVDLEQLEQDTNIQREKDKEQILDFRKKAE